MKRKSLTTLMCVAALSAACNGKGTDRNQGSRLPDRDIQQSASIADRPAQSATDTPSPADGTRTVGTSGSGADQTTSSGSTASAGAATTAAGAGDERQFTQQAAIAGMAEVELGRLAEQRASDSRVKEFARMMVRDHSKSNDELKAVAKARKIQLPTQLDAKHQELKTRLQSLRGAEFDREYMRAMVDGHMEARDLLSREAGNAGGTSTSRTGSVGESSGASAGATGRQPTAAGGSTSSSATGTSGRTQSNAAGVEQWASKTLPTIEHHLDEAQQINSRVQNNATGSPGGASRPAGSSSSPTSGSGTSGSGTSGSGTSGSGTSGSGSSGSGTSGSGTSGSGTSGSGTSGSGTSSSGR